MEKKNVALNPQIAQMGKLQQAAAPDFGKWIESRKWVASLSRFYSSILDENVPAKRALALLQSSVALTVTMLPFDLPVMLRSIALVWLVMSVRNSIKK